MPRKPQFYGWTLLAVVFSLDFVNVGFPPQTDQTLSRCYRANV